MSKLSASQEDYLEAILDISDEAGTARVRDIASRLGVSMPSVTVALRALSERGMVNYEPYKTVTLSPSGKVYAQSVRRRHKVLRDFLTEVLGVDAERAEVNACRLEHAVDDTVLDRIESLVELFDAGGKQVEEFQQLVSKWQENENE